MTKTDKQETERVLLGMIAPDTFEGDGLSYWQLTGIPIMCSWSWFFILLEVPQFSICISSCLVSYLQHVSLEHSTFKRLKKRFEVNQNLQNTGAFKGIEIVGVNLQVLVDDSSIAH